MNGFNKVYHNIPASDTKVGYASTGVLHFWNKAKGKLTHLSYIFCKPETLGTEFNTAACNIIGTLILIETHRGK